MFIQIIRQGSVKHERPVVKQKRLRNGYNYADRLTPQYSVIAVFICTSNTKICTPLLKKNNSINTNSSLIRG